MTPAQSPLPPTARKSPSHVLTALALAIVSTMTVRAEIVEIREGAANLKKTLEAMPWTADGDGPAIYTFEFSECPHCQSLYRDWAGKTDGVQMRHMFYAVSPRSANEMTALAKTRDVADYKAYMEGRKTAPLSDNRRLPPAEYSKNVAAFNSIITPLDQTVEPILRNNGVMARNLVSPTFIWEEGDKMYAMGGYSRDLFSAILTRVKAAGGAPPIASAASPDAATSAPDAGSEDSFNVDIIGLKLGMTQAEALATIRAYNPNYQFTEVPADVAIQDSNRRTFKAATYMRELRAGGDQGVKGNTLGGALWKEQIVVTFPPPPNEHRVQYIRRVVWYHPGQGPAFDATLAGVAGKYGNATHTRVEGNSVIQLWLFGDDTLTDTQVLNWFTRSKISNDLQRPGAEGGFSPIVGGRSFGVYLVPHGHGVSMMGALLSESRTTMELRRDASLEMANGILQAHEAKLREATQKRAVPQL